MSEPAQNFENHAKFVRAYHGVAFPMLLVPTLWFAYQTVTDFSINALMFQVFAVGLIIAVLFARLFPLGVQDRVIRLEEQMGYASLRMTSCPTLPVVCSTRACRTGRRSSKL